MMYSIIKWVRPTCYNHNAGHFTIRPTGLVGPTNIGKSNRYVAPSPLECLRAMPALALRVLTELSIVYLAQLNGFFCELLKL